MRTILYFTNITRLNQIDIDLDPLFERSFLSGQKSENWITYDSIDSSDSIILVPDKITISQLQDRIRGNILDRYKEFSFIYHSLPAGEVIKTLKQHPKFFSSYKSVHDKLLAENSGYVLIAPILNEEEELTSSFFDDLWSDFVGGKTISDRLAELNDKWINFLLNGKHELAYDKFYYVHSFATPLVDEIVSKGLPTLLAFECLRLCKSGELEGFDLIINCEQYTDFKGSEVALNTFAGLELAKRLRLHNFRGRILFVSQEGIDSFQAHNIVNRIIWFRGHDFIKLPNSLESLVDKLLEIDVVDDLTLHDLQSQICDKSGAIRAGYHDLEFRVDNFYADHIFYMKEVCAMLNLDPAPYLSNYTEDIDENDDVVDALAKLSEFVTSVSRHVPNKENSADFIIPEYKWKILWLDDELIPQKGKEYALYRHLSDDLKVDVKVANSYKQALQIWEDDFVRGGTIKVVIADFRIYSEGFNARNKQGYHFLRQLSDPILDVGLFIYSGLPRKFLIESVNRKFGINATPFSKINFPPQNNSLARVMSSEMVKAGDEAWLSSNNYPTQTSWQKWINERNAYVEYRSDPFYQQKEKEISILAKRILDHSMERANELFDNFSSANDLEATLDLLWSADSFYLPGTHKIIPTNMKGAEGNKWRLKFLDLLTVRRVILGLFYAYKNKFSSLEVLKPLIIALITRATVKGAERGKDNSASYFSNAAILPRNLPIGLLPEEYRWLEYDSGLHLNFAGTIKSYWSIMLKFRDTVAKHFSDSPLLKEMLESTERIADNRKTVFGNSLTGTGKSIGIEIYFDDHNEPMIRTVDELKSLLQEIYDRITPTEDLAVQLLGYFVPLCREIIFNVLQFDTKDYLEVASLISFIKEMPSKFTVEVTKSRNQIEPTRYLDEDYMVLIAPWEMQVARSQRNNLRNSNRIETLKDRLLSAIETKNIESIKDYKYKEIRKYFDALELERRRTNNKNLLRQETNKLLYLAQDAYRQAQRAQNSFQENIGAAQVDPLKIAESKLYRSNNTTQAFSNSDEEEISVSGRSPKSVLIELKAQLSKANLSASDFARGSLHGMWHEILINTDKVASNLSEGALVYDGYIVGILNSGSCYTKELLNSCSNDSSMLILGFNPDNQV